MPGYPSTEAMTKVIDKMVNQLQGDEKVVAAIKTMNLSIGLNITDLKAKFHLAFRGGQVYGGTGDDPKGNVITLGMTSETFDDMFSGAKDAMGLAMTGKMSFSGDTSAGMGLMGAMGNLQRAYKQARSEAA